MMVVLFFLFGFLTNFNGQLQGPIKEVFNLSNLQTSLLTFAFFTAFVITGAPASGLIRKYGNKKTLVIALLVIAVALGIFLTAANIVSFTVFVLGSFILGAGITILQVVANPYLAALGSPETAGTRINLAGGFNSLAGTLAPLIASKFVFDGTPTVDDVKIPYIALTVFAIVLALVFNFLSLPEISAAGEDDSKEEKLEGNAFQFRHLTLGVLAIFCYVGAEVAIGNNITLYLRSLLPAGSTEEGIKAWKEAAGMMATLYWGGLMVGRFVGSSIFQNANAKTALASVSALALIFTLGGVVLGGEYNLTTVEIFGQKFGIISNFGVFSLVLVGLFHSVMWGYIFGLAINGIGKYTKQGSGYLIMGIFGGALVPFIQSGLADHLSWKVTFLFVALCHAYLLYYALIGSKPNKVDAA